MTPTPHPARRWGRLAAIATALALTLGAAFAAAQDGASEPSDESHEETGPQADQAPAPDDDSIGAESPTAEAEQRATTPPERLVHLFATLDENLGEAEDCDAIASTLTTWLDAHSDELVELKVTVDAHLDTLDRAEIVAFDRALGPHMDAFMGAAIACGDHDATLAVLDDMDALLGDANPDADSATGAGQ